MKRANDQASKVETHGWLRNDLAEPEEFTFVGEAPATRLWQLEGVGQRMHIDREADPMRGSFPTLPLDLTECPLSDLAENHACFTYDRVRVR
jgi:hypothetical protein